MVDEIITVFMEDYVPAPSVAESDIHMTSRDILESIGNFFPDDSINEVIIFDRMKKAGFKYKLIAGQLRWIRAKRTR